MLAFRGDEASLPQHLELFVGTLAACADEVGKILLGKAGLPEIRFHDLRHTAASLMLNNNIAPIMVSRCLGHARASITMDIYAHLIPTMQAEVADRIDDLVFPVPVQLNPTKVNR